ncbi:MAG: hypothetical protein K6B65_02360 [Bacilli bacterium]|nr:hypothetical protein [Bacilli bacterium]
MDEELEQFDEELSDDAELLLSLLRRFEANEDTKAIEDELNDIFPCYPFLRLCGDELIAHGERFNHVKKLLALHEYAKANPLSRGEVCGDC